MNRRMIITLLIAGAVFSAICASTMMIVVTDRSYICENTGSKKGHREWIFGAHTNNWYRKSELERFMEISHPNLLKHSWTSFAGDGRSLIPLTISRGHGRPGPILSLDSELLDQHVSSLSDAQRLELYQIFSNGSKNDIRLKVESIVESRIR